MNFVALDVETSNEDIGSICQIGLAAFKDGQLIREWVSLVNPEEKFSPFNINIHGLTPADAATAPTLPELTNTLHTWLDGQVVVCHTLFDQRALSRAFTKYKLAGLNCRWLDSCRVARGTWSSSAGHSLAVICDLHRAQVPPP